MAIRIGSIFAGLGLLASLFVIGSTIFIITSPSAKHHVDRISWRLFTIAMGIQMMFAIAYILMYFNLAVSPDRIEHNLHYSLSPFPIHALSQMRWEVCYRTRDVTHQLTQGHTRTVCI